MKLSGACTACEGPAYAQQPAAIRAKAATASTRSNAELTVFTAEGDKVTVSASFSAEAGRFNYGSRGGAGGGGGVRGENGRQSGGFRYSEQQASINVSVEGDLNADEIADIQRLASILTGAASGNINGDQDEALRRAAKAAEKLDSLQSFEYSYSQSTEYSYARLLRRSQNAPEPLALADVQNVTAKPVEVQVAEVQPVEVQLADAKPVEVKPIASQVADTPSITKEPLVAPPEPETPETVDLQPGPTLIDGQADAPQPVEPAATTPKPYELAAELIKPLSIKPFEYRQYSTYQFESVQFARFA